MIKTLIIGAIALLAALHLWRRWGPSVVAAAAIIIGLTVFDRLIYTLVAANSPVRTSIASSSLDLRTPHLALLVAAVIVPATVRRSNFSLLLVAVPIALLSVAVTAGDLPPNVLSGIAQWGYVALAWTCGSALAVARRTGRLPDRPLALILLSAIAANGVAVALQLTGRWTVASINVAGEELERVSGLQGHSGNLGKVLLLLLVLSLPLTRSADRLARSSSIASVAMVFVMIGFTFSRANTVAMLVGILLWFTIGPGSSALGRITVPLAVAISSAPFLNVLLQRNAYDPGGGSRPVLVQAARDQLGMTFWWGIGPNDYQRTVGAFSDISAVLPVHSVAWLTLVEAGALITVLIAIPLSRLVVSALTNVRSEGIRGSQATAVLAFLPGIVLIAMTGHGLAFQSIMLLMFFVAGHSFRLIRRESSTEVSPQTDRYLSPAPGSRAIDRRRDFSKAET